MRACNVHVTIYDAHEMYVHGTYRTNKLFWISFD